MGPTSSQSQEDLLEEQHYYYINQVNQSGIPLWYYEFYYYSMYSFLHICEEKEVNRNRRTIKNNTNNNVEDILPF